MANDFSVFLSANPRHSSATGTFPASILMSSTSSKVKSFEREAHLKISSSAMLRLFVVLTLIALGQSYVLEEGTTGEEELNTCHFRELDICFANLAAVSTSESGIALTEKDLDRYCKFIQETADCLSNYVDQCTTEVQAQLIDPQLNLLYNLGEQICNSSTDLRKNLLKHSKCIRKIVKYQKPCVLDVTNVFEYIYTGEFNQSVRADLTCCGYKRVKDCIRQTAFDHCGQEEGAELIQFSEDFHARVGIRVIDNVCGTQKDRCDMLPTFGTSFEKPGNKKLKSVLYNALKAYTSYLNSN